jgi:hypothetical protein
MPNFTLWQIFCSRTRAFRTEKSGAAAVEFAITVIPFIAFLFMIFEVGLYFSSQQALDYATRSAARQVMTGSVQAQGLSASQFKTTLLCPALRMPLPCNSITVSLYKIAKDSDPTAGTGIYAFIDQSVPSLNPPNLDVSKGTYCAGAPGDYIFVDVAYKFMTLIDISKLVGGGAMTALILRSTAFIANEPYSAASGSTGAGC